jgi:NhaP-type Na+/H+ or K+/H+ antiporter/mannitol/fructose-specific phosphotransferase system IIA component (Ntr-type)
MIKRLLSWGVLTTWLGIAGLILLLFGDEGFDVPFSLLSASLVIVTGPTVIAPLLKRIQVNAKVTSILHWEGVLIDPIGVFIALLCFEWIAPEEAGRWASLSNFAIRIVAGLGIGLAGGFAIDRLIRWRVPPRDVVHVFSLGMAVLVFGIAEHVRPEAGLLAVTVAGFLLGVLAPPQLKSLRQFKAEITDLMVGMLFILLVARLDPERFLNFGLKGWLTVALVMLVIRPLNIFVSSWGQDVSLREKLFLSWVAPRGIVAASMASLFALHLASTGSDRAIFVADFLETFTYSVIAATVVIQGFTAGPLAWLLGVRRRARTGWIIVGAHELGRAMARFVTAHGCNVVLLDTNARAVAAATKEGLQAVCQDARDPDLGDDPRFVGMGNLLALTDNAELNVLLCQHWEDDIGTDHLYRWGTSAAENGNRHDGRLVWSSLSRPTMVSADLERARVRVEMQNDVMPGDENVMPLAAAVGEHVQVELPGQPLEVPAAVDETVTVGPRLVLHKKGAAGLAACVRPRLVFSTDAPDRTAALLAVAERVCEMYTELDPQRLLSALEAREGIASTGLGHGVAVPHTTLPGLERRVCAIVRTTAGLRMASPDGEPVHLMFVMLSPENDDAGHLLMLGEIARLVSDESARHQLRGAENDEELAAVATSLLRNGR